MMKRMQIIGIAVALLLCFTHCKPTQKEPDNEIIQESEIIKIGIILETKEAEKAWNALRFANACLKNGHEVKCFLMGEAVECEGLVTEKFDVDGQLKQFVAANGEVLACGTCLKSRQLNGSDVCPISTMNDCVEMVEWADKVVTF